MYSNTTLVKVKYDNVQKGCCGGCLIQIQLLLKLNRRFERWLLCSRYIQIQLLLKLNRKH